METPQDGDCRRDLLVLAREEVPKVQGVLSVCSHRLRNLRSPAESVTFSGLMEKTNPICWQKVKVPTSKPNAPKRVLRMGLPPNPTGFGRFSAPSHQFDQSTRGTGRSLGGPGLDHCAFKDPGEKGGGNRNDKHKHTRIAHNT